MRIGIDIGGVVIGGPGNDTQFFTDDYLATPAVRNVWGAVWRLYVHGHTVFFISKAGPKTAAKTVEWLKTNANFIIAPVILDDLVFCKKREQKAPIARMLELDVFIDDRQDICDSMELAGIRPILFKDWQSTLSLL